VPALGGAFMLARFVDSVGFRLNAIPGKTRIRKGNRRRQRYADRE
jgi:hypothetical protein